MIMRIAKKDLLVLSRDRRLLLSLIALPLVLAFILYLNRNESRRLANIRSEARSAERENWLNLGDRDPHGAAHHGTYAFKPVSTFRFFDPGFEPYLGTTIRLEAHKRHRAVGLEVSDSPDPVRMASSAPAQIIQKLAPLLIILLGFSSVSGERERGTLPLTMSFGVRAHHLNIGKAIAIFMIPIMILIPVSLSILAAGVASESTDLAIRSILIITTYALYLGGWVFLTVAASAWFDSSRSALTSLLFIWVVTVLIIPRFANETANRIYPLPSAEKLETAAKSAERTEDGKNRYAQMYEQLEADLLKQYGVKSVKELPVNIEGARMLAAEELSDKVHENIENGLAQTLENQNRFVRQWGYVSPSVAMRTVSMSLSGTDWEHHRQFEIEAEDYRRNLVKTLNEFLLKNKSGSATKSGRNLWESVPEFEHALPQWNFAVASSGPCILTLLVWISATSTLALLIKPSAKNAR